GESIDLSEVEKEIYLETNENFSLYTYIDHDFVVIHDPQPLPIIQYCEKRQPWIWRCHVDLSKPDPKTWEYLKSFILRYDVVIVSSEEYKRDDLPVEQRVITPCIDPLAAKNRDMSQAEVDEYIREFEFPLDKPIITQISRFDKWKDPIGVVEVFKKVRKEFDCRLVLCGSMASDDPEGLEVYEQLGAETEALQDSGDIILINSASDLFVNALQKISAIIIQKSLREGFGLTVTEALWKEKPVVASRVGGIPLQITDGENGFLAEPTDIDGFAEKTLALLNNIPLREEMGRRARVTVRDKFLPTTIVSRYLDLLSALKG
ncbi:MAG: glycosyltransferase, partial [Terriglobia bacterium]